MKEENKNLTYEEAMHGIQTSIAYLMMHNQQFTQPKHLRVGIDSCMVTELAVARLLIEKGIITEAEYLEAIRVAAIDELEKNEETLFQATGTRIKLR